MPSLIGKAIRTVRNDSPVPLAPKARGPRLLTPGTRRSSMTGQMEAYGRVSTLFSIVERITSAAGQVEWHLYRKQRDARRTTVGGEEKPRTELTQHAALSLWNRPNPFYDRTELEETLTQHDCLTGEQWLVVASAAGMPLELWPVRPDRMEPIPHATKFIAGYIYTGPDGEQVPLNLDQVIFMRRPNPLDPYRGMGPVQSLMVDLESADAAAEWNRNFFRNSAEPGGIIEVDHVLDDDEFDQLTDRWREQHQGVGNAHRVAVLEQGKWVERKYSMKDMQFAELRGVSREIIREAFGIHSHMLGISEDVNKANAQEGERSFARWVVTPVVKRRKRMLNGKLLPLFKAQDTVEFDHDRIVPEDREADDRERISKAQAAQLLVTANYNAEDVAEAVGLPPMRWSKPEPPPAPTPPDAEPDDTDEPAEDDDE